MDEKLKDVLKSKLRFWGFEFDRKTFLITIGVGLGILLLLGALTFFGVAVSWYGVFFGLGFLVALFFAGNYCRERSIDPEFPYTLIWFVFPLSILGARIYYLTFNGGIDSFVDIFRFWEGGLAIYGGVIGGLIGLILACLIRKVNIIKTTDVIVPLLSLGQFFGRIGCIFGQCCYGLEVTNKALQWFPISIYVNGSYHYATNFYESILNLILCVILTIILRKTKNMPTGITTCSYLVGYGLIRFILETFRAEEQTLFIGSYPVSKLLSAILVIVGVCGITALLIVNNLKNNQSSKTTAK